MSKILCIYPKDATIEFLQPVYDMICTLPDALGYMDDSAEDDYFENLECYLSNAEIVFFLGHGSSSTLYGQGFNQVICEENGNIDWLRGKHLFIDACNSADFISRFKLDNAVGFGLLPTSEEDINKPFHRLPIKELTSLEIDVYCEAKGRIWQRTIQDCAKTSFDIRRFVAYFKFYTNVEIVHCLKKKGSNHYRTIADMLYYLIADMEYIEPITK